MMQRLLSAFQTAACLCVLLCVQMANSPNSKPRPGARLERHSAGAPGSRAYGFTFSKQGAGKYNWGERNGVSVQLKVCDDLTKELLLAAVLLSGDRKDGQGSASSALDSHDPMYDSDRESS